MSAALAWPVTARLPTSDGRIQTPICSVSRCSIPRANRQRRSLMISGCRVIRGRHRILESGSRSPRGNPTSPACGSTIWPAARQPVRLTSNGSSEFPVWRHDGTELSLSWRGRSWHLASIPTDGSVLEPKEMLEDQNDPVPQGWAPDGKTLLYQVTDLQTGTDIMELDGKSAKSRPWLQTRSNEREARFSPDGRWVLRKSRIRRDDSKSGSAHTIRRAVQHESRQTEVTNRPGRTIGTSDPPSWPDRK